MDDALTYARERADDRVEDLKAYLRIPSVSTDEAHRDDVREAAGWVRGRLRDAGLEDAEVRETDGHPVVTASWMGAGDDAPTILIYGHYDVQPPDPLEEWETPPFEPTVRDGRIYARGSTDDKGQSLIHMEAVEAYLEAEGELPVNVRFLVEGEEEVGSPNLEPYVRANQGDLACDAILISDSAMWAPGVPAITTGMRGLAYFQIEVRGTRGDLHSGVYGGAVRNPAIALAEIIASFHDDDERIAIEGFYDDVVPLSGEQRAEWEALEHDDEAFREELGVPELVGEAGYSTLERRWARPSLDVNGIWGGFQGEGEKTVIPARASAKVSMRLVGDQRPDRVRKLLHDHVERVTPTGVTVDVIDMHHARPVLVPREEDAVRAAERALAATYERDPVAIRSGGTIPVVATFVDVLQVPTVLMGFGLRSENLHAPNEHFHLENLHKGVEASIRFLEEARDL